MAPYMWRYRESGFSLSYSVVLVHLSFVTPGLPRTSHLSFGRTMKRLFGRTLESQRGRDTNFLEVLSKSLPVTTKQLILCAIYFGIGSLCGMESWPWPHSEAPHLGDPLVMTRLYSICDSQGSNFDIIFYHIL